jgi:hypothetical protein
MNRRSNTRSSVAQSRNSLAPLQQGQQLHATFVRLWPLLSLQFHYAMSMRGRVVALIELRFTRACDHVPASCQLSGFFPVDDVFYSI